MLRAELTGKVGSLELEVELEVDASPWVIVGPNGAGKTSLLFMLLGLRRPRTGRIELDGRVLFDARAGIDVPTEERRLGFMPQHFALFPHQSVRQNVEFSARASSDRALELMRSLGIDALAERRPLTLSGGEQQRVALCRMLAGDPRALLLDEPLAALDASARHQVRQFLAATLRELALPAVTVTHDREDARALGRTVVVLESGRIAQQGSFDAILREPRCAFARELAHQSPST